MVLMMAARKEGGLSNRNLAEWLGVGGGSTITQAVKRPDIKDENQPKTGNFLQIVEAEMSNVKMCTRSLPTIDGIPSDPGDPDTYNMGGAYVGYGDNEVRCRKQKLNLTVPFYPTIDWASPGCQTKITHGP